VIFWISLRAGGNTLSGRNRFRWAWPVARFERSQAFFQSISRNRTFMQSAEINLESSPLLERRTPRFAHSRTTVHRQPSGATVAPGIHQRKHGTEKASQRPRAFHHRLSAGSRTPDARERRPRRTAVRLAIPLTAPSSSRPSESSQEFP
jgi:hypothetical protein